MRQIVSAGAIDEKEAKRQRDKLQEESSFFGSMDGATKFVKGDATAGLIITVIIIGGGTIMGITRDGMSAIDALQNFGQLTIGDGLSSQIPSLLISLSTGILVSKGSTDADFGTTVISQLFGLPRVMYLVVSLCYFLVFSHLLRSSFLLDLGIVFSCFCRHTGSKTSGRMRSRRRREEEENDAGRRSGNLRMLYLFCRSIPSNWNSDMESYLLQM